MASISRRTMRWVSDDGITGTAVRFQAHYRDRAGRQHRRMIALKKEARAWLDVQTAGLVTGQ